MTRRAGFWPRRRRTGRNAEGAPERRIDYLCLQPTREGQASRAHVYEIVAGLRRRGWQIRVIEPPHPRPGRMDGIRRAVSAGVVQVSYWVRCRLRPAPFVYIRNHFLSFPTAALAKAAGSVVVQEVNSALVDAFEAWPSLRPLHRLVLFSVRTQLRWADAVITVTPGLVGFYEQFTGRRDGFHVIGNGADVTRFVPQNGGASRPSDYVVFVGALASWQGIDVALDALDSPFWPAGINLVVAGDGRERERVRAASTADSRVRWLGTIPYSEAAELLAGSLASLVPKADGPSSRHGLSPLKLFEAMASGVPVVASDLAGLRDVIQAHDCGILVPAGDPSALARAVAELANDRERAAGLGARGRAAAVERYSWDARAAQTEQVLLEVAGRLSLDGPDS